MALPWRLLLLFALLLTSSAASAATMSANKEALALLSFKSAINEDPESSLSNWNSSSSSPCSFNGVTCRNGAVISLAVPNKRLLGSLSSSISSLSSLRHLNLHSNRLYGPLPAAIFHGAAGLQSLVLYGNIFSGQIPPEIGSLVYLTTLDLSNNSFSGELPDSLLHCRRLKALVISRNNLSGDLPVGFGNSLILLERLDLSFNNFNESIPADIGNLSRLQGTADFSHNRFTGLIPPSLGNLPEKVYIDLSYNNLSGPIPQNGALVNRGPTAFIGNPGLCGPPLKDPCGNSSLPFIPDNVTPPGAGAAASFTSGSSKGVNKSVVVAIVVGDVVGLAVIALVFYYCYRRATSSRGKDKSNKKSSEGKECLCFRKGHESDVFSSEDVEHLDLVPLDLQVKYDLDELLKASAFVLGKSGIGIVYKVVLEDGLTLAVRRLGEGGSQRFKEFRTEVEAIGKVRHTNIVPLRAYYWSVDEKLLIYDYIPNGNLSVAIHGKAGMVAFTPLSWDIRFKVMKGVAKGLAFLHEFSPKKYVHGDLKPSNILIGTNMEPYIADFGLGHLVNIAGGSPLIQSNRMALEKPVSPITSSLSCYQAPEALRTLKPSQKWDIYSYGVILLELISGRSPLILLDTSEMDLVRWVQFCIEKKKPLVDVLDPLLVRDLDKEDEIVAVFKIALACVQTNPERRPSMRNVAETLEKIRYSN